MVYPNPNSINDLRQEFVSLNPEMDPIKNFEDYLKFWIISMNVINFKNINATDQIIRAKQTQINQLSGRVMELEQKMKKVLKKYPDILKD